MIQRILIFTLISILGMTASAQQEENTRPMWGVKAAFDINIPGKWHGDAGSIEMYRMGYGGTIGAVYNIYLGRNFYLEPGISLFYDTYSYKDLYMSAENTEIKDPGIYKAGIRIPIVAGYEFSIANRLDMIVFTGPELNYAFTGDVKIKDNSLIDGTELAMFGKDGYQRRIDCAWKIGAGFPLDMWTVSVEASIGMTDLMKTEVSFRENRVSVGVTRYF